MYYTWRRKTPQNVQLFFKPIVFTISSIVHPYKSLYETIFSGSPYWKWKLEWEPFIKLIEQDKANIVRKDIEHQEGN